MPISMKFEALLSLQPRWWFSSNHFILFKDFNGCRDSVHFVVEEKPLRGALGVIRGRGLKWFSAHKLLFNLITRFHTSSNDK